MRASPGQVNACELQTVTGRSKLGRCVIGCTSEVRGKDERRGLVAAGSRWDSDTVAEGLKQVKPEEQGSQGKGNGEGRRKENSVKRREEGRQRRCRLGATRACGEQVAGTVLEGTSARRGRLSKSRWRDTAVISNYYHFIPEGPLLDLLCI